MFPVFLLQRSDVLRNIIEWKAPAYTDIWQTLFLVQIAIAVAVLAPGRAGASRLPFIVLVPAALHRARNILVASLVLTAAMAPCLKGLGDLKAKDRLPSPLLAWTGAATLAALCALVLTTPIGVPSLDLRSYPVPALAFIKAQGLLPPADGSDGRLLAQDFVGNFREYLDGPVGDVLVDDRAEVLGRQTAGDYVSLLAGALQSAMILDRYDIKTVVWQRSFPLASCSLSRATGKCATSTPTGWLPPVVTRCLCS